MTPSHCVPAFGLAMRTKLNKRSRETALAFAFPEPSPRSGILLVDLNIGTAAPNDHES
jgi:hypothetical protein